MPLDDGGDSVLGNAEIAGNPAVAPSLIDSFQNTGSELVRLGAVSGLAAELLAPRLRCSQSRLHALADQVALELGDPGKHEAGSFHTVSVVFGVVDYRFYPVRKQQENYR